MGKYTFPCGHSGGRPIENKDVIVLGDTNAFCTVDKKEFTWIPAHWHEKVPRVEPVLSKNPVQTGESGQTAEMEAPAQPEKRKIGIFNR